MSIANKLFLSVMERGFYDNMRRIEISWDHTPQRMQGFAIPLSLT